MYIYVKVFCNLLKTRRILAGDPLGKGRRKKQVPHPVQNRTGFGMTYCEFSRTCEPRLLLPTMEKAPGSPSPRESATRRQNSAPSFMPTNCTDGCDGPVAQSHRLPSTPAPCPRPGCSGRCQSLCSGSQKLA